VRISLRENGLLTFEVRDDGPGLAKTTAGGGAGITNMRDRLAAVGGELTVDSAPGRGTRIMGRVPLG
jgi:signal transduction histidine kinase